MRTSSFRPVLLAALLLLGLPGFCLSAPPAPAEVGAALISQGPDDDQRREDQTTKQGTAQRLPGEADTTFLRRVLPVSFPNSADLVAYQCRPSTFGQQLFFSVPGGEGNEYGRDLFVLDPYQADTYAVQVLTLESLGDETGLAALFFADVDQNGQKELLTLLECSLREPAFKKQGTQYYGRVTQYQTVVFQYAGLSEAGRPHYRLDPVPRPYLDNLPTVAAVRQALAKHPSRGRGR
ncbi:hypothetical protein [Hymenobacter chitinivorans]|uniref:Uncharacterized protein n=1 Tax=Hymenobacter chitinivorans DSM 11115 TaxID=1121954 RepID=A0A2M9BRJ4_9BACT|nr:hypothetical protein [Hymenobacter chitinivorans]PJJ60563.1 hypothetical protein CLV45_1992 [Hymenobacter chitinivorans DSM 11115]